MARRPFHTRDALIVVSTDGYFDVFPPEDRRPNAKPAYRGVIAELGPTVRDQVGGLSVRPDSVLLDEAVAAWSERHGAAAVQGALGARRDDDSAPLVGAPERPSAASR